MRSVTEQRGEYSARLKLAHRTNANECLSWPTVCANEDSYRIGGDSQQSKCLSAMARRGEMGWPSPSSQDHKGAPASRCTPEGYNARLDEAVILHGRVAPANPSSHGNRQGLSEDWRTPTVAEEKNQNTSNQIYLQNQVGATVKQWATPIMGDSHLASTPEVAAKRLEEGKVTLSRQKAAWPTPASSTGQGGSAWAGRGEWSQCDLENHRDGGNGDGQTQPALGRDPNGAAGGMDYAELCVTCDNRTDELRLLGNGVVPATAERAFRVLSARFTA